MKVQSCKGSTSIPNLMFFVFRFFWFLGREGSRLIWNFYQKHPSLRWKCEYKFLIFGFLWQTWYWWDFLSNFKFQANFNKIKEALPIKAVFFLSAVEGNLERKLFSGDRRYKVIKVHLVGNLWCGDVQSVAVDVKMSFRPENCFHMSHVWCKSLLMEFFSWKYCELEQCVLIGRAKYAFYRKNRTWYETCAVCSVYWGGVGFSESVKHCHRFAEPSLLFNF